MRKLLAIAKFWLNQVSGSGTCRGGSQPPVLFLTNMPWLSVFAALPFYSRAWLQSPRRRVAGCARSEDAGVTFIMERIAATTRSGCCI